MDKNKVIKSVSFNQKNIDDEMILKHVKRRNFSGYVKKLILADINKNQKAETIPLQRKVSTAELIEEKKKEMKKRAQNGRPFIPRKH